MVEGMDLRHRSKKRGETAAAFEALAEGIACQAFAPGGVMAFGVHWKASLNENSLEG